MELESTIIKLAEQKLLEFKSCIDNPDNNERLDQINYITLFSSLNQLIELSAISESGFSKIGIRRLQEIELKMQTLVITAEQNN
jgi:hypothetical protein